MHGWDDPQTVVALLQILRAFPKKIPKRQAYLPSIKGFRGDGLP